MTPPMWYGRPQFAYETWWPRSSTMISWCSSSRRNRAAADIPPATPPTITVLIPGLSSTSRAKRPNLAVGKSVSHHASLQYTP